MNEQTSEYRAKIAASREAHFSSAHRFNAPLATLHAYCRDVDKALRDIYANCIDAGKPDATFCLIALGGYGRRELWPFSDVDILILHENQHRSAKLSRAVKIFWNIGLAMGCVTRTIAECAGIIGQDLATDTALLESRYLCGNRDLFNKLQNSCIKPYFARNKNKYIEEISAALREGIYSSANSLYRVEPNIKNGICTLRDCQRLLWAERVRCGVKTFADLATRSGFSITEAKKFEADYSFLASLRTELHLTCGQRMDVLETDYQNIIAARFGYGQNEAGMLMEKFFKAVRDIRLFLLSFLEKDLSGKSVWSNVRRRVSAVEIAPGIAVLDGIIFSSRKKEIRFNSGADIILLFQSALTYRATLSVELQNRIRHAAANIPADEFKAKKVGDIFLAILSRPESIGQLLLTMHETEVLDKLVPPFASLTCKVEYDQYHEFTVDQHILLAMCICDEMEHDPDEKIKSIYQALPNKMILRLSILLHDIGKGQPGDHAQNGAIIAENICDRLGLNEEQTGQIRFLVYHHLEMSSLSLLREADAGNIKKFAANISDLKTLNNLYLLTIADIKSVGPNTWTGWKAFQLEQLYDRALQFVNLSGADMDKKLAALVREKAHSDASYFHDILPEDRLKHVQWLAEIADNGLRLHHESFTGFERLTVCDHDRAGFLSDIIGCITSEGYNILSARIYSTDDGKVLDIFHLEEPDRPRISAQKRINNIYRKWELIKTKQATADDLVHERIEKYPPASLRLSQQKQTVDVYVNNTDAQAATIVEIDAADNFGLLHKIARCFHENGINIVSARLSTRSDTAVDVFYVTDSSKRKIANRQRIDFLIHNLTNDLSAL